MLYILTPIFCVALLCGAVFSFSKTDNKAYAATGSAPASILSLNGDLASKLNGAQKENIYFGTNNGEAVKWRVLDTGGNNKYSAGKMLLWADKQLDAEAYNSGPDQSKNAQPNYAYWSTSKIRASLNGGSYPNSVTGTNMPNSTSGGAVGTDYSWYGKLFTTDEEKNAVMEAGSYTTDNWGLDNSLSQLEYKTSNITATGYGANGKYNQNILGTGTAASAVKASANNGVQETSTGDYLFLLDYYDINNTALGFGDGALTYAKQIDSSWTASSGYYPGRYSGAGTSFNNNSSNYLKSTDSYWIRPAGRLLASSSAALIVDSSGCVWDGYVSLIYGVRPAFNLNAESVVYATAANVSSIGSTLTAVDTVATTDDGKPAYKLYVKKSTYKTGKAICLKDNDTLKVAYKAPSNFSSGNLVLLLSNTDGSVKYQAVQSASNNSTDTKVASFTLPSGVTYGDYTATLLFTSARGDEFAETVYASYSLEGGIEAPQNVSGLTFDNQNKWTEVAKSSWYDAQIHGNTSFVTVKSIEYTDKLGNAPTTDSTGNTANIKNAGTYKVTLQLADGLKWSSGDGTFTITIDQAKPNVTADFKNKPLPNPLYVSYNDGKLPELTNVHEQATPGKLEWQSGEKPDETKTKYYWQFTPEDENDTTIKNNYSVISEKTNETEITVTYKKQSVKNLEIALHKVSEEEGAANVSIYDAYTLADGDYSVKKFITVYAVMDDGVTKVALKDDEYDLELEDGSETLSAESLTLVAINVDGKTGKLNITALESKVIDLLVTYKDNGTHLVYSDTLSYENVKTNLTVRAQWNYSGDDYLEVKDKTKYTVTGELKAGTPITLTANYGGKSKDFKPTIDKGTLTPTVTFDDLTVTYDGTAQSLTATVSGLPDGVTLIPTYTVTGDSTTYVAAGYSDAGTYNYAVSFTHNNPNYAQYTTPSTATLKIDKADVDMSGVSFANKTEHKDGTAYTLTVSGTLPTTPAVSVTYSVEGQSVTSFTETGTYKFTAKFTHDDNNYNDIPDMTATLTISDKPVYDVDGLTFTATGAQGSGTAFTATYDPDNAVTITLTGKVKDKDGAEITPTVTYELQKQVNGAWETVTELKKAGTYKVVAKISTGDSNYADIDDKTATLTIAKADVDTSGVKFDDDTVAYDGKTHTLTVSGTLPTTPAVTVTYSVKGTADLSFTDLGDYEFTAKFTHDDSENYNDIADMTATLKISDASILGITAKVEDGARFTTVNTLDDLKAKLTVTVNTTGGDSVTEDYELSCEGLHDGKFKFGLRKITVKYTDADGNEFSTFVEIGVEKVKVALPTFKGGLNYTGVEVKPKAADFNGYDETLMTFVVDKLQSGLTVGTYKAVFALKDFENYEWATATTLKKSVFAVAYDEVVLNANEAAVDWNISKAVLTATKSDGALPVFASESFIGAFADVVTLKYYKDEACTEEIAAADLARETQYYVKAELIDTDNFELDTSAAQYTVKSFTYTTPAKELTIWDKVVRFLKANWLWLVIAVAALILLIIIIACAVRAAKRKREREEQRRLEEKAERERKEEREEQRRREEREERMARLSQQQAMPQMMMPQMMPPMMGGQMPMQQSMPQQAQAVPMAAGGASSSEIAELKAEILALKTAQESAKEIAELKAENAAMKAEQNAVLRSDVNALRGGEQVISGGISLDKLTEIIRTEVNNALDGRAKAAAQPAAADNGAAATQVPPDAVMTTVTTTKIDTTKKPAQTAQAAAPVRTVVRNVVAPMPVDDGRVFDVGGFYKPADPVTDMGFTDEENKE